MAILKDIDTVKVSGSFMPRPLYCQGRVVGEFRFLPLISSLGSVGPRPGLDASHTTNISQP